MHAQVDAPLAAWKSLATFCPMAGALGWHFEDALVPHSRMRASLEYQLVRRPPQHGGKAARAAFEAQRVQVRAILNESDGVSARVTACLDVVPERRSVTASAALQVDHPQNRREGSLMAKASGDGMVPSLAGWPRNPASLL